MSNKNLKTPSNRFELLGDRLKTRFLDFMWISILMGLFLLPHVVWTIFINNSPAFKPNEDDYLLISLLAYLPYILTIMIFGTGMMGALYYSKRLAFNEGANASKDFFYGIGQNFRAGLLGFFIIGLFYFLLSYSKIVIISTDVINSFTKGIFIGLMYVGFILITMIVGFYLTQSVLYTGRTSQLMMNSIKFSFGMFGWNLLIMLIVLFPFIIGEVVSYLPTNIYFLNYINILICIFFYLGFEVFVFSIYSHAIFDLTINDDYPEIYRKGLTKEDNE